jgi:hypothetical protein
MKTISTITYGLSKIRMIFRESTVEGTESFNYIMMTLFRIDDPGLIILPTYRLVKGLDKLSDQEFKDLLGQYFKITEFDWHDTSDPTAIENIQEKVLGGTHIFGAFIPQLNKRMEMSGCCHPPFFDNRQARSTVIRTFLSGKQCELHKEPQAGN